MLRVIPQGDARIAIIRVSNVETSADVALQPLVFVLTLEREPNVTFARGQLRFTVDGAVYPFQSNAALFERLNQFVTGSGPAG